MFVAHQVTVEGLRTLPGSTHRSLYKSLRQLIVAFDNTNTSDLERTTVAEVTQNADLLVELAVIVKRAASLPTRPSSNSLRAATRPPAARRSSVGLETYASAPAAAAAAMATPSASPRTAVPARALPSPPPTPPSETMSPAPAAAKTMSRQSLGSAPGSSAASSPRRVRRDEGFVECAHGVRSGWICCGRYWCRCVGADCRAIRLGIEKALRRCAATLTILHLSGNPLVSNK
jgi:hypothetical protein